MTAVHWAAVSLRNQPESGMYKQSCSGNSLSSFCCCIHQHDLKEEPKMRSSELSSFFRAKVGSETHCRVGTGTDASGYTASKGIKTFIKTCQSLVLHLVLLCISSQSLYLFQRLWAGSWQKNGLGVGGASVKMQTAKRLKSWISFTAKDCNSATWWMCATLRKQTIAAVKSGETRVYFDVRCSAAVQTVRKKTVKHLGNVGVSALTIMVLCHTLKFWGELLCFFFFVFFSIFEPPVWTTFRHQNHSKHTGSGYNRKQYRSLRQSHWITEFF